MTATPLTVARRSEKEEDLREPLNLELKGETLELHGPVPAHLAPVVTADALRFVASLAERFESRRNDLLSRREVYQAAMDEGGLPGFDPTSEEVRRSSWQVAPPPAELRDRRIEITGPTERKMVINALNSGAHVYMADLEDAHTPLWRQTLEGQRTLYDAVRGQLEHWTAEGKHYALRSPHAVLMVRPRGWHLDEKGLTFGGEAVPASLFDLGLYVHANAQALQAAGSGTYLYLPKLQSGREAALWEEVLSFTEEAKGLAPGSIRCTVLIETLPALFQMHEILHALRRRVLGLNFGRWDYLFSFIKTLRAHADRVLPDRSLLTMDTPFMQQASRYLVRTCHERGAQAIGGMAADIPVRDDADLHSEAVGRVSADKRRELEHGYDGTWIAHPGLVSVVSKVFDAPRPPISPSLPGPDPDPAPFLSPPPGNASPQGVAADVNAAVQYLESWLRGVGAAAIHNRMEDTATAEICRTQLWQWVHLAVTLSDGRTLTPSLFQAMLTGELGVIREEVGQERYARGRYAHAGQLLQELVLSPELEEFLTLHAGPWLERAP